MNTAVEKKEPAGSRPLHPWCGWWITPRDGNVRQLDIHWDPTWQLNHDILEGWLKVVREYRPSRDDINQHWIPMWYTSYPHDEPLERVIAYLAPHDLRARDEVEAAGLLHLIPDIRPPVHAPTPAPPEPTLPAPWTFQGRMW